MSAVAGMQMAAALLGSGLSLLHWVTAFGDSCNAHSSSCVQWIREQTKSSLTHGTTWQLFGACPAPLMP